MLRQPHHGLFYLPVQSRFGPVAAKDEGLGTTQLFAVTLVYNGERTGEVELGGRRFWFRRVRFPKDPPPEWYVVDLLQNERWMAEDTSRLDEYLVRALRVGRLDRDRLREMAAEYARPAVRERLMRALAASASAA
ncbi:MAG: hypothetical protein ABMA64_04075 [Myxococcota bacterium]